LGLALANGDLRGPALRAGLIAVAGLALAWLSSAGYLPDQISNTPVYLSLTATVEAFLVAFGLASAIGGLGREAFGFRQVGTASLRYGLTPRVGALAIDTARPFTGPGSDAMREALGEILSGTSIHGGALLAPFGVRYLVASDDQLNDAARTRLDAQVDLDIVPAAGLAIWVNDTFLHPAAVLAANAKTANLLSAGQPAATQRLTAV